jgi:hypothetical protein
LLVLIILIVLLVIGYAVRALDGGSRTGSWPAVPHATGPLRIIEPADPTQAAGWSPAHNAQDGGRLAAKAAMPSCACGPAK